MGSVSWVRLSLFRFLQKVTKGTKVVADSRITLFLVWFSWSRSNTQVLPRGGLAPAYLPCV